MYARVNGANNGSREARTAPTLGLEVVGETGQGIEQMGHAHQVVVTHHGIPVQGEGMRGADSCS